MTVVITIMERGTYPKDFVEIEIFIMNARMAVSIKHGNDRMKDRAAPGYVRNRLEGRCIISQAYDTSEMREIRLVSQISHSSHSIRCSFRMIRTLKSSRFVPSSGSDGGNDGERSDLGINGKNDASLRGADSAHESGKVSRALIPRDGFDNP